MSCKFVIASKKEAFQRAGGSWRLVYALYRRTEMKKMIVLDQNVNNCNNVITNYKINDKQPTQPFLKD